MASLKVSTGAVNADLLATQDIRNIVAPSVINLFASGVTNGDLVGLRLDRTIIMDDSETNIEVSADVIDASRDQMIFNSVVGRGTLRLPVAAVTTEVQVLLSVEPIL